MGHGHSDEASRARYQPHAPTAERFADSWYCYVQDPEVGITKLVFLTFADETTGGGQHGYVHVAHAPLGGTERLYDHWATEVVCEPVGDPDLGGLRFEIPGVAVVDERSISFTLPDVSVHAQLEGPLLPYFPGPEPTASPFFGPLGTLPTEQSHWFVHTLATPTRYRYQDAEASHAGVGPMYVERGWSVGQVHGFCYLMAVSDEASLVLTCGMPDDDTQVWAGRLVTPQQDLTFVPFGPDAYEATSTLDADAARVDVRFAQGDLELHVTSAAPLSAFYDQITPSQTVFGADTPVTKTMDAELRIDVRRGGVLVERVHLPQSIFELAGACYPPVLAAAGGARRPMLRYA
jgi:hypothetical protein